MLRKLPTSKLGWKPQSSVDPNQLSSFIKLISLGLWTCFENVALTSSTASAKRSKRNPIFLSSWRPFSGWRPAVGLTNKFILFIIISLICLMRSHKLWLTWRLLSSLSIVLECNMSWEWIAVITSSKTPLQPRTKESSKLYMCCLFQHFHKIQFYKRPPSCSRWQ